MLQNHFTEILWYWETFKYTNSPGTWDVPQTVLLVGYDVWLHLKSAKWNFLEAIYVVYFPKYICYEILEISGHFKIFPFKQKQMQILLTLYHLTFSATSKMTVKVNKSFQSNIALLVAFQKYTFLRNGDCNHHWGMQMVQTSNEIFSFNDFAKGIEQNML